MTLVPMTHVIGRTPTVRRFILIAVVLLSAACLSVPPAHARKVMFGSQEHLVKLQDVPIKGPTGEALYLGYKYAQHAFIAPYYVSDDGYILGVVGQDRYFKLDSKMIAEFQTSKLLPTPLPPYELSIWDYVFGYLLWIILGFVAVSIVISGIAGRRKAALVAQATPFANDGLAHHRAGNLDLAIADYSKALDVHPKFVEVLQHRGNAHQSKGDHDRAIADFSKMLIINGKNPMALLARGAAFESKDMTKLAIDDYSRAIKLSKAAVAYYMRGNAYLGTNDFKSAIKDYSAAIKASPDFAAAYQNRATAYDKIGKQDLAQDDLAKAQDVTARQQQAEAQQALAAT
jgi:tetratricopeptide (TPR) repeat protein